MNLDIGIIAILAALLIVGYMFKIQLRKKISFNREDLTHGWSKTKTIGLDFLTITVEIARSLNKSNQLLIKYRVFDSKCDYPTDPEIFDMVIMVGNEGEVMKYQVLKTTYVLKAKISETKVLFELTKSENS